MSIEVKCACGTTWGTEEELRSVHGSAERRRLDESETNANPFTLGEDIEGKIRLIDTESGRSETEVSTV